MSARWLDCEDYILWDRKGDIACLVGTAVFSRFGSDFIYTEGKSKGHLLELMIGEFHI